jgi:hypothetical protein
LKKHVGKKLPGLIWFKIQTDKQRALVAATMNIGFHEMPGISWLAEELLDFEALFCYM